MPAETGAAEVLTGPYAATVEHVVDGDTIAVRVSIWLKQDIEVLVRVRGVDAPERRGGCDSEKERAAVSTNALAQLVSEGRVTLTEIEGDKYYGRVVANVATPAVPDVGQALLAGGFARVYDGSTRQEWCPPELDLLEAGALARGD